MKNKQSRDGNTHALIYCRVSSDKQKYEGNGLDSQEHRCTEYAKQKGYAVHNEYIFKDTFSGGGDYGLRPALSALLTCIDENPHKAFVFIFDDLSRFAREVSEHIKLRTHLKSKEVPVECINFQFEDSPEGRLIENLMASQHEYHRENNARSVIQKQKARLEMGFWAFRAPKGYKMAKDSVHGKILMIDKEHAPQIKYALEGFANGTFPKIIDCCRYLCEQGYWGKQSPEKYIPRILPHLSR